MHPRYQLRSNQNTMPKEVEKKEDAKVEKSDRQARWEKHVANYAIKNPVKYAAKKANKEFDTIPASFV